MPNFESLVHRLYDEYPQAEDNYFMGLGVQSRPGTKKAWLISIRYRDDSDDGDFVLVR